MPKISVIIPIFKVEKYIEQCARSLFEQTLDDIEYIFIDDCSPDNSMRILEDTITTYKSRLIEKHQKVRIERMSSNSGLATVRKHGINMATGEFLIHCDSDDWVDTDLYEKMYNEAIRTNSDIVLCPICDEYKTHCHIRSKQPLPATCKLVVANWWNECIGMFCWNKLVRRNIYTENNLEPFEGVNMWEDNGLMLRVFYFANGLSQIEGSVYHYNQANVGAITYGYGRDKVDQMIKCAKLLDEFFDTKSDRDNFYKTVLTLKYLAKLNLVTTRYDWLKEFKQLFPESNVAVKWIRINVFSTKGKIRFLFVKYHLAWLFVFLFKIKGRNRYSVWSKEPRA